jgi:hypothetical protein
MLFHYESASAAFAAPDDSLSQRPRDLTTWTSGRFGRTGPIWKMRGSGSRVSWESPPSRRESLLGTRLESKFYVGFLGRPGSSKRLLCRRTETLSAGHFGLEPPMPQGGRRPPSSARSRGLASPWKRRCRNCSKRKSSARLSGRGGRFDAQWFSLRRRPFFH